mgnify:CR=1 FL=1|jgi:hypothetical protein|tara:strand:+ start:1284 stop:1790 length:507 start_codon:yes stop_codon:yes gene_type:complete
MSKLTALFGPVAGSGAFAGLAPAVAGSGAGMAAAYGTALSGGSALVSAAGSAGLTTAGMASIAAGAGGALATAAPWYAPITSALSSPAVQGIGNVVGIAGGLKGLLSGSPDFGALEGPAPVGAAAKQQAIPTRTDTRRQQEISLARRRAGASSRVKNRAFSETSLLGD